MAYTNKRNNKKILSNWTSYDYAPRWGVFLLDILLCTVAFWISVQIGKGLYLNTAFHYRLEIWEQFFVIMGTQTICFAIFHTYAGILRYSTFIDTIKVLMSVFITGAGLISVNLIFKTLTTEKIFFNTALIMYIPIAFVLLFCIRVGVKTIYETVTRNVKGKNVYIYGAKEAGIAIAKMLRSAGNTPYCPMGFLVEEKEKHNFDIFGLHVYPLNSLTITKMKARGIHNIIISPLKLKEINPAKDLKIFIDNNIHILTTPYFTEFENDNIEEVRKRISAIDSIKIEDLLERPEIEINLENVRHIISNNVILVSGAAGSIGSELVRQIQQYNPKATILLDQAESPLHDLTLELRAQFPDAVFIPNIADVRNRDVLEYIFAEYRPDVVYHAAAYKHVPLMESFPNEAIKTNVLGTKNMADIAVKYNVKRFVMISTDKAVNPTNVMGASKRIAEIYVQSMFKNLVRENPDCTKFITTRFGNVLGSNGSVIPYFKKQIAMGGPVTVTHPEIIRYFMTIPEACSLVMEASTIGEGGEIFVFDMGQPVKILDLAKNMIRLAGYTPGEDIQITFTGLRPGEKLYEELLNQKEITIPTSNQKIMVAKVLEFPFEQVQKDIDELIALAQTHKTFPPVQQMKKIVPEFISKNSVFEKLDK